MNGIVGTAARNMMTKMTGISGGDSVEAALKMLGMPDAGAAMMGALSDLKSNNLVGFQQNMMQALTGSENGNFRDLFNGKMQMPQSHHCCSANQAQSSNQARATQASNKSGFLGGLGKLAAGFGMGFMATGGNLMGGLAGAGLAALTGNVGQRAKGQCCANRARRNKGFLGKLGGLLGGGILPNLVRGGLGLAKGALRGLKGMFKNVLPSLAGGAIGSILGGGLGGMAMGGALGAIAKMTGGLNGMVGQLRDMTQSNNSSSNNGVSGSSSSDSAGKSTALDGPFASMEDFMFAVLSSVTQDMQKELREMAKELKEMTDKKNAAGEGGGKSGGKSKAAGGKGGGLLGTLGKVAGTAFGGPIGGALGGAVGGMLGGSGGGGSASGASGSQSKEALEDSRQQLMEKIKNATQKLQQAFQSLSGIMNNMHNNAMATIRNIR